MLKIAGRHVAGNVRVEPDSLDAEIMRIGGEIADALPASPRNPLERIDRYAMDAVSDDAELRAALFRFVDVLPALPSAEERAQHLLGYLSGLRRPPLPLRLANKAGHLRLAERAIGQISEVFVRHLARRFIIGETPESAFPTLLALAEKGIGFSVDLLGESTVSDAEAERYEHRCRETLEVLARSIARLPSPGGGESDSVGPVSASSTSR